MDLITEKRKRAKNEFGKTMENMRKRIDVKLVNTIKKAKKLTCKPSCDAFRIFNENLVAITYDFILVFGDETYKNTPIHGI